MRSGTMPTRALILAQGNQGIKIYKEADGYPEEVVPLLLAVTDLFREERGFWDPERFMAQVLIGLGLKDRLSRGPGKGMAPPSPVLGYALTTGWRWVDYIYFVRDDYTLEIYQPGEGWGEGIGLDEGEAWQKGCQRVAFACLEDKECRKFYKAWKTLLATPLRSGEGEERQRKTLLH